MRKLGLKDAFSVARIIKAANIRDEIVAYGYKVRECQRAARNAAENAAEETAELNVEKVGFEFFVTMIAAVANEAAEKQIYKLYADIKGATPEDVSLLDFATVKEDIKEIIEQNDLKSFFNSVSALMLKQ